MTWTSNRFSDPERGFEANFVSHEYDVSDALIVNTSVIFPDRMTCYWEVRVEVFTGVRLEIGVGSRQSIYRGGLNKDEVSFHCTAEAMCVTRNSRRLGRHCSTLAK